MKRLFALALSLLAFPPALCPAGHAQKKDVDKDAEAQDALARRFGKSLEVATDYKPHILFGDFNGDTFGDLLALARLQAGLPRSVQVLNPWGDESGNSSGNSDLALVIVHGTKDGWKPSDTPNTYVLTDRDFFSTPIWEAKQADLLSVSKKAGPRAKNQSSGKAATGDTISLATEAGINVTLYWDGKTYRLDTPQEEP